MLCFAQSVLLREQWQVPTFMKYHNDYQKHQDVSAFNLGLINNWLKEGALHLRFGLYMYPASVEMPSLANRNFYGSYPPGAQLPVYLLFKTLDSTGIVPDLYEKRDTQLLLLMAYNYVLHFILALTLCCLVFLVCLKLGFNRFNSTLLAFIPAIVQFHNASSLYHHHLYYNFNSAVMLPLALYVLLEFLRTCYASPRVVRIVRIGQPLLMFYGILTEWLFVFVVLTIYLVRCLNKEITLPASLPKARRWLRQSLLFFTPALLAIALWAYQVAHYLYNIAHDSITSAVVSSRKLTLLDNLLYRMGLDKDIDTYLSYLHKAFIIHPLNNFEIMGVVILALTFLLAIAACLLRRKNSTSLKQAATVYLVFFVPSVIYNLFFMQYSYDHIFSSLKFSLALSLAFVLLPVFMMRIVFKNHLRPVAHRTYAKNISWVALVGLTAVLLYGYGRIGGDAQITKMFAQPDYEYVDIGDFVRDHTDYQDVVFSESYYVPNSFNTMRVYFTNKVIHRADSADDIYQKTQAIEQDFTINFLYLKKSKAKADKLADLLISHALTVHEVQQKEIGGLWSVDGQEFNAWYANKPAIDP